jgi:predicted acyltransferase
MGMKEAIPERLASLDVLRGLTLIGMIVVNAAIGLEKTMSTFPLLLHSQWAGFTIADAVFPAFLFMVGVSVPIALRKEAGQPLSALTTSRILRRSLLLILIGVLLHNLGTLADFDRPIRPFGVLQRIGVVYGACAFLFLVSTSRTRMILILALLLGYWALLYVPCPDGLATNLWQAGHNFVSAFDRVLLGVHRYHKGPEGYDPEGLLSDIPSVAHGLIGVAVGEYLQKNKRPNAALHMAITGTSMMIAGVAWGSILPVVKDIWSPSFVLVSCGLSLALLAALHFLLDGRESAAKNPVVVFCLAFGMNSIAAYVTYVLASDVLEYDLFTAPYKILAPLIGGELAELVPIVMFLILVWLPMAYLRKRGWIIKV